jgi:tetratricopeptide (TPR) repeat protein
MPGLHSIWLIVILALSPILAAEVKQGSQAGPPSEEAAISDAIKRYYAAYAEKNLPLLARAWSERSPEFSSTIHELARQFAAEDRAFSNITISRVRVAAGKAIIMVEADVAVTDARDRAVRHEKLARAIALIKDGESWRVWREAAADTDLSAFLEKGSEWRDSRDSALQFANALVRARSDDERDRMMADNKEMLTAELRDRLLGRARMLEVQSNFRTAISLFRIIRDISDRLGDKRAAAAAQRSLANSYRLSGQNAEAVSNYQVALSLLESLNSRSEMAAALAEMGAVYFAQKKYREAIEAYSKALKEYEALKDRPGMANTLEDIASVHYDQEHYDEALNYFQKSLALREAGASRAEVAATIGSIGNVYFQQQDYGAAIANYQKALALFEAIDQRQADHRQAIAGMHGNLGSAHLLQGDYEAALDRFQRSFKIEEELRNRRNMGDALLNIAKVYSALGNHFIALESLQKGLAHFEAVYERSKAAGALAEIGDAYLQVRNYDASIENYQKSLGVYLGLNADADAGTVLSEMGNAYFLKGDYEQAVESYQRAIWHYNAIEHAPGVASLLGSIASARYSQAKLDLAMEFFQKSLAGFEALGDRARAAATLERIASVYFSRADYVKSLEVAARAGSLAEQVKEPDTLWRVRLTEAMNYRALAQTEKAAESLEQSIAIIEAMRERVVRGERGGRFYQNKAGPFLTLIELLIAQGKMIEAYDYAERVKNNLLWDALQSGNVRVVKTMTAEEQEQERRLEHDVVSLKATIARESARRRPDEKRLADFNNRLRKAVTDYRAFEGRLYAARPRLKALRSEAAPLKIEQAARLIENDRTALVEFVVADSRIYLFVLTREAAGSQRRAATARSQAANYLLNVYVAGAARAEIASRVGRLREMIAEKDEGVPTAARELYDLLLRPAAAQLEGKTGLVIVPDSFLWHLPFQALQPAENRYLVEECAVSYAPSLTALNEMARQGARAKASRAGPALLAVGNPAISRQTTERVKLAGYDGLEGWAAPENEVRAIGQIYGPAQSKVLTGAEASEEMVKQEAGRYRAIHLAAPALLSDASPAYSHVILSSSEESGKEDGLFEAWEVARQNLAGEIVLISSGETARARVATGEAVMTVSWAWLVAGCPTLVLSQWRTDAPAATGLMTEFHRNLKEAGAKRARAAAGPQAAEALRQATLKVLRSDGQKHPFHWAAFRAIGY